MVIQEPWSSRNIFRRRYRPKGSTTRTVLSVTVQTACQPANMYGHENGDESKLISQRSIMSYAADTCPLHTEIKIKDHLVASLLPPWSVLSLPEMFQHSAWTSFHLLTDAAVGGRSHVFHDAQRLEKLLKHLWPLVFFFFFVFKYSPGVESNYGEIPSLAEHEIDSDTQPSALNA